MDILDVIQEIKDLTGLTLVELRDKLKEEDCCEWKLIGQKVGIKYYRCCKRELPYHISDKKYCPYCGKRIKMSEVE